MVTARFGQRGDGLDFVGGAAYWGAKYQANRGDTRAALGFARNLRLMGGNRQAVAVMKEVVMAAPDDPAVLSEYGKALTGAGRPKDAIPFLSRAAQINADDWSTLSALGVAFDQAGDHKAAQQNYQAALRLSPANPAIETNLAMSLVLEGRIDEAEVTMRRLVARPDASPQMRQNLSMIATLKGNVAEAEQLAREDLPPTEAENNLAILRQMNARNAPVNTEMLAPPPAVAPAPAQPKEAALEVPALPAATAIAAEPETPKQAATPVSLPGIVASPVKPAPVMMAPINDDEDLPAKPALATSTPKAITPTAATAPRPPVAAKPAAATVPVEKEKPAKAAEVSSQSPTLRQSFDVYRRAAPVSVATAN